MHFIKVSIKFFQLVTLGAIFLFGVFLYFYKLDKIPSGFYIDEALPGYNAYSLLLTGKDEYGKNFPLFLRFYGSYNPPLYTYLTIPVVALLGLNVFSVRFISALAGLLSAFVIYFFLKNSGVLRKESSSFLGALLFIISPWIILHSRVGYEVSLAFLIFSLGALFVFLGIKKSKFLVPGFIFLSLSTYSAYSERFLVPIFILGALVLFRKQLSTKKARKHLLTGLALAIFIQIPHIFLLTTPAFFPKTNLLSTGVITEQAVKVTRFLPLWVAYLLAFLREFLSQYFTYFSPRSLFFLPDPDLQRSAPELSVFYFWMIVPYFVGIYTLWRERHKTFSRFVLLLAIISPIPASLTRDPFSTHRALPLLLPLILIVSIGADRLTLKVPKKLFIPTFSFLLFLSLVLLWRSYFVFLAKERASAWGYGFAQLAAYIKSKPNTHFVIDQARIKPAYIKLAFFMQYPPSEFQKRVDQSIKDSYYTNTEFNPYYNFANIETRNVNWEEDIYKEQILVGDELTVSYGQANEHFLTKVFEIRDPIEQLVFIGYITDPKQKCANTNYVSLYCKDVGR